MGLFNRRRKRGTDETMQYGAKLITVAKPQNPVSEQFFQPPTLVEVLFIYPFSLFISPFTGFDALSASIKQSFCKRVTAAFA